MTVRDIQAHLGEIDEVEVSPDLISRITDGVLDEVKDWQARSLDSVYPVIFLDAIVCKVRDNGIVRNKAAHPAVGVDVDGRKEVLGIWVETTEGAKFWLRVMNELRARGIEDVLLHPRPTGSGPAGATRTASTAARSGAASAPPPPTTPVRTPTQGATRPPPRPGDDPTS